MKFSCQLRLTPEEKSPELNGRRVDPKIGLGVLGMTKASILFRESKPQSRMHLSPVPNHCTDQATHASSDP